MVNAMLLRKQDKRLEALAAYEQAIKLRPAHRSAYIEKAYIEIGLSKFEAAQADLNTARKLAPGNMMITYVQAVLDSRQNKIQPALESVGCLVSVTLSLPVP